MPQFTVIGRVPPFNSNEFYLRVENDKELEEFFKVERIDTRLGYAEGKPVIGVRGRLASVCKPGDRVRHIIETQDKKNGFRGIVGISIKVT